MIIGIIHEVQAKNFFLSQLNAVHSPYPWQESGACPEKRRILVRFLAKMIQDKILCREGSAKLSICDWIISGDIFGKKLLDGQGSPIFHG
jgi:hypothetical protein